MKSHEHLQVSFIFWTWSKTQPGKHRSSMTCFVAGWTGITRSWKWNNHTRWFFFVRLNFSVKTNWGCWLNCQFSSCSFHWNVCVSCDGPIFSQRLKVPILKSYLCWYRSLTNIPASQGRDVSINLLLGNLSFWAFVGQKVLRCRRWLAVGLTGCASLCSRPLPN